MFGVPLIAPRSFRHALRSQAQGRLILTFLALACLMPIWSEAVQAGEVRDTQMVSASVINSCRIMSVEGLLFGRTYNPVSSLTQSDTVDHSGKILLRCTQGATGRVGMDQGKNANNGSSCSTPDRRLHLNGGEAFLSYRLIYQDDGAAHNWGCGTDNGPTFSSTSSWTNISVSTLAQILGGQDVTPGEYNDMVIISINF